MTHPVGTPTERLVAYREDGIGHLVFNQPERRNALSLDMWEGIPEVLAAFAGDDEVRVVVLRGAGEQAFCAGADISQFEDLRGGGEGLARYGRAVDGAYDAVATTAKPTIAEIRGFCMGGGMALALACDLRFAAEDAVFGIPAAKLGIGYTFDHTRPLVDQLGPLFAKEILFTGRRFDAREAFHMGMLNRLLPGADLAAHVREQAGAIAANAPLSVRAAKRIVDEILKDPDTRDVAACEALTDACASSADHVEGRRAFMEKRPARFDGR